MGPVSSGQLLPIEGQQKFPRTSPTTATKPPQIAVGMQSFFLADSPVLTEQPANDLRTEA